MNIHFVCRGNTFRSRIAEAYLNSKSIPEITATSSGIYAGIKLNGPIDWYAMRIIFNNHLVSGMSACWEKTNTEIFKSKDLIIFMSKRHYEFCHDFVGDVPYEIWDIEDMPEIFEDAQLIAKSESVFMQISGNVEVLLSKLQA